jgi:hypothetical protein
MTETPPPPNAPDEPEGDELRQHAQEPSEGADSESDDRGDVPRVHPEDPAEG